MTKDPKRAVSVAAATIVAGVLLVVLTVTNLMSTVDRERRALVDNDQPPGAPPPQQGAGGYPAQPGMPPPNWQEGYRNWQQNQRENQIIMDDIYKSQRDSFDKQLRTYEDSTYDWRHRDDD